MKCNNIHFISLNYSSKVLRYLSLFYKVFSTNPRCYRGETIITYNIYYYFLCIYIKSQQFEQFTALSEITVFYSVHNEGISSHIARLPCRTPHYNCHKTQRSDSNYQIDQYSNMRENLADRITELNSGAELMQFQHSL